MNKEWKNAAVHVDIAYTLIARFSILLYLCLWKHQISQARALMSLRIIIFQFEILYSARLQKVKLHSFRIPKSAVKPGMKVKEERHLKTPPPSERNIFREESAHLDAEVEEEPALPLPPPTESPDGDCESLSESHTTNTATATKKKKKIHLKNLTRAFGKLVGVGSLSERDEDCGHVPAQVKVEPSCASDISPGHHHSKFAHAKRMCSLGTELSSSSDEEGEVVVQTDKKCEEWKPRTRLDVTPVDGNLLMEDVYAPVSFDTVFMYDILTQSYMRIIVRFFTLKWDTQIRFTSLG